MRAIIQSEAGGIDQCTWSEIDSIPVSAGMLQVRVHAAGLNPADYKLMTNGFPGWEWPHIPGLDGAGEISAIGEGVTNFAIGERVAFHTSLRAQGSCAEYVVVDPGCVAPIPDGMEYTAAASVPCAGLTAYQLIHRKLPLLDGRHTALVHAGAGGVGGFAIQLLARLGVRVLTTCSAKNNAYCQELGAAVCIDYNGMDEEQLTAAVLAANDSKGVDVVFNTLNRDSATADMARLNFAGHLCFIAGQPHFDQFKAFSKALSFHEAALGAAHLAGDTAAIADIGQMLGELLQLIDDAAIQLLPIEIVTEAEIPAALTRLSERHVRGKIVATLNA